MIAYSPAIPVKSGSRFRVSFTRQQHALIVFKLMHSLSCFVTVAQLNNERIRMPDRTYDMDKNFELFIIYCYSYTIFFCKPCFLPVSSSPAWIHLHRNNTCETGSWVTVFSMLAFLLDLALAECRSHFTPRVTPPPSILVKVHISNLRNVL